MSSLLTTFRELLGPPDPRSERELEDDIDAEFAFHIEELEAELIEQGVPPEHAHDLARARFGNQAKLKQRCKRIALEERIMLQKINTVLMIVVMLAVVGVSIQMYFTQRHNSLALQDITTQIANMRVVAQLEARDSALAVDEAEPRVLVEGDIEQPGWYSFTSGETLRRDILTEIGIQPGMFVTYYRGGTGTARPVRAEAYLEGAIGRSLVAPNDRIFVLAEDPSQRQIPSGSRITELLLQSGTWRQVDEQNHPIDGGVVLDLLAAGDIHNPRNRTVGTLSIPGDDRQIELSFSSTRSVAIPSQPESVSVTIDDVAQRISGRWILDSDVLVVNLTSVVEETTEPIRLRRVSDD